ncbi:MAG: hypothetical protein EBU16_05510, partial [Actinobacteria bacterium]|nr:hypothetical protein [Actinomycetota bacterium]
MQKGQKTLSKLLMVLLVSAGLQWPNAASAVITHDTHLDLTLSQSSRTVQLGSVDTGVVGLQIVDSGIVYAAGTYDSTTITVSLSAPSGSALTAADVSLSQTSALITSGHYTQGARSTNSWQFRQTSTTILGETNTVATIGITPDVVGTYSITFTDGKTDTTTYTLNVVKTDPSLHSLAFTAGGTSSSSSISAGESATVTFKSSYFSASAYDSLTVKAVLVDAPSGALGSTVNLIASDSSTASGQVSWSTLETVSGSTGLEFGVNASSVTAAGTIKAILYAPTVAGTYTMRIVDYYNTVNGSTTVSNSWSPAITPLTFTV